MPTPYQCLRYQISDSVAEITLHRPASLNSLNAELLTELREALEQTQQDGARAVILTGEGRGFCSGADLADQNLPRDADGLPLLGKSLDDYYHPMLETLYALPLPVVHAVNGVAAGAGASIALAGDIVIAARSASFKQAFVNIGLVPDASGTWLLPRLTTRARAMGMCMLGDSISAEQALAWGMIWQMVEDDQLMAEGRSLAARLAAQPTRAIAAIKTALRSGAQNDLSTQLDIESRLQTELGQSQDFIEGVSAFLEKRPPRFTGR